MQSQLHHFNRPDSPSDNNNHPNMLHHLHSQDPIYSYHTQHNGPFANNANLPISDYVSDIDSQKQNHLQNAKINPANFRTSFTTFPNAIRSRPQNTNSIVSPNITFHDNSSAFYASHPDSFPSQLTSPVQAQMQAYDSRNGFEFNGASLPPHKQSYTSDHYNVSMMSHQAGNKGAQQHGAYATQSSQYPNGLHLSSQTPYGPHVPSSGTTVGNGITPTAVSGPPPGLAVPSSGLVNGPNGPNPEEISTIFVVGFPDDMQEREFQNLFTFSSGFEAATLKIPNKEYNAYGGLVGSASAGNLRNGTSVPGYTGFSGSNDPYNMVTANQGGVVVDGGRDGTASWPASIPIDDPNAPNAHYLGGAGGGAAAGQAGGLNMPPRKQIIGFARFRTREEALAARDVLQGRRVDIEKGAVLKAEMAKKNLHTKRGVGPVPGAGPSGTGGTAPVNGLSVGPSGNLLNGGLGGSIHDPYIEMPSRDKQLGPLESTMGVGRLNHWRDSVQDQPSTGPFANSMRDHEDERHISMMNAMGLGTTSGTRGPRERIEEEERERRRKEKELRLRAGNSTAFDAFHSVPPPQAPPGLSRQSSNLNGANVMNIHGDGILSPNALPSNVYSHHQLSQYAMTHQSHQEHHEVVGPWDNLHHNTSANGVTPRPRSSSQHSVSPPLPNAFADNPRAYSPSYPDVERAQLHNHTESSSSSLVEGSQHSVDTNQHDADNADHEASRPLTDLAVTTNNGTTSPQLPSPASGASSRSARGAVDQYPPINTLYVGNLPTSPSQGDHLEDSLRELFRSRPGFRRLEFRQKNNGPMCFVEFEDVNYATKALNELYGNTLQGSIKGGGIRLSYSKNPLGVRTPTSAGTGGPSLQQQQQQAPQNGAAAVQPSTTLSYHSEAFQPRQPLAIGEGGQQQTKSANTLRRDIGNSQSATSPASFGHGNYMASPPPRFFGVASSTTAFTTVSSSTPLSSNSTAFLPRSVNGLLNFNFLNNANSSLPSSTFSPFGPSTPSSSIPDNSEDPPSHA